MLRLQLPTDPRWVDLTEISLEAILSDHAYCEQKAAAFCISLIQQFPDKERLVDELSPIVTEEWGHFRLVLKELKKRDLKLGHQRKDEYVNLLRGFMIKGGSRESRLLDNLLVCALIEARSCERFRVLSLHISDDKLKEFYHKFMVAEAAHYTLFIELAREYAGKEKANERWAEFLTYEKEIMKTLEIRGDRIH
jgi:tRNA-(ms[2]io[6]A)-hydroxylase